MQVGIQLQICESFSTALLTISQDSNRRKRCLEKNDRDQPPQSLELPRQNLKWLGRNNGSNFLVKAFSCTGGDQRT